MLIKRLKVAADYMWQIINWTCLSPEGKSIAFRRHLNWIEWLPHSFFVYFKWTLLTLYHLYNGCVMRDAFPHVLAGWHSYRIANWLNFSFLVGHFLVLSVCFSICVAVWLISNYLYLLSLTLRKVSKLIWLRVPMIISLLSTSADWKTISFS